MSQITSRQLEAFRAVMITGSMTGAAEFMNMTQPAISRLIRDLEAEAGIQLFERHANHLVPTRDASTILEEVERSFIGLGRIKEFITAVRVQSEGSLRIGAMSAFASDILPRYAAIFMRNRPAIRVELNSYGSPNVFERVASGQLDFGYVMNSADRPGFYVRKMSGQAVVAMTVDHPLAAKDTLTPQDFTEQTIIGSFGNLFQARIDLALGAVTGLRRVETSFSRIACVMASEGVGVAFVDPFSVREFRERGLVTRSFNPGIECDYGLVVSQKRLPTPLAEAFIRGFHNYVREDQ